MKTKKLSNFFCYLLVLLMTITGVLSGCGNPDIRSDEDAQILREYDEGVSEKLEFLDPEKTITISGWLDESCVKNLMAFLAEQYPDYTFKYNYISKNSYEYIVDTMLASKTADDIVLLSPTMAKKHAKNRYIEDVTIYCDSFNEEGREAFMYGNKVYAVPCTSDFQCVFYNKEILEKSGQSLPGSFKGFLDLCDYMQNNLGIKPMSAGLKDSDKVANTAMAMLASGYFATDEGKKFGGRLSYGRVSFYEEIRPYLGKWQDLCMHKVYTRQMCIMDDTAAIDEFASGKSFMYMGWLYDYNRIKEANPDIRLGTMALSTEIVGKTILIGGCNSGFAVNKFSKKIDIAMKVESSIASLDGQRALWSDRQGSQTYLEDVDFDNPDEFDSVRPLIKAKRVVMPWNEWGSHSSEIYELFGVYLQKVVLGEESLEIAFETLDDEVRHILLED